MGDYVISWKKSGDIYRRVYSFRSRVPKGARTVTDIRLSDEEGLEKSRTLRSKMALYSDLYAETNTSPTFNPDDIGHDFCVQTWTSRPCGNLAKSGGITNDISASPDAPAMIRPGVMGALAAFPLQRYQYDMWWSSELDEARDIMEDSINNALWAQCPDRISGSLGQDVVDVVAFGKSLDKLLTLRSQGESLFKQFSRFSAKKRRQIDETVRQMRKSPKQARRIASQRLASGYLSWLFQYLPWVEDLQTILEAATSTYLRARGVTRKRSIINLRKAWDALLKDPDDVNFELTAFMKPWGAVKTDHDIPWRDIFSPCPYTVDVRDDPTFTGKLTCSVVSSWTQNYEHGALEPLYELNKKLGLVYPSLIWDLIPWSWLVDWFVNVGDFIDRSWMRTYGEWNCSYAYATTKLAMTWHGLDYFQTTRWHIHPGLGLTSVGPESLNASQWGILTALGLSHRN